MPLFSMVMVFISVKAGKVGEYSVVDASGIMTVDDEESAPVGVQFSGVVQAELCDPFQVYEVNSDFERVFSSLPKSVGK